MRQFVSWRHYTERRAQARGARASKHSCFCYDPATRGRLRLFEHRVLRDAALDRGHQRIWNGWRRARRLDERPARQEDRKSTRLNSSHQIISYAVFCLKKKTNNKILTAVLHLYTN